MDFEGSGVPGQPLTEGQRRWLDFLSRELRRLGITWRRAIRNQAIMDTISARYRSTYFLPPKPPPSEWKLFLKWSAKYAGMPVSKFRCVPELLARAKADFKSGARYDYRGQPTLPLPKKPRKRSLVPRVRKLPSEIYLEWKRFSEAIAGDEGTSIKELRCNLKKYREVKDGFARGMRWSPELGYYLDENADPALLRSPLVVVYKQEYEPPLPKPQEIFFPTVGRKLQEGRFGDYPTSMYTRGPKVAPTREWDFPPFTIPEAPPVAQRPTPRRRDPSGRLTERQPGRKIPGRRPIEQAEHEDSAISQPMSSGERQRVLDFAQSEGIRVGEVIGIRREDGRLVLFNPHAPPQI